MQICIDFDIIQRITNFKLFYNNVSKCLVQINADRPYMWVTVWINDWRLLHPAIQGLLAVISKCVFKRHDVVTLVSRVNRVLMTQGRRRVATSHQRTRWSEWDTRHEHYNDSVVSCQLRHTTLDEFSQPEPVISRQARMVAIQIPVAIRTCEYVEIDTRVYSRRSKL